ncbi:hypothetical protein DQ04_00411220 [Trypanosoma grayi]|uniref:hypothetical protein n=1 Tax=Trypanosoma grayi TaxID=71804 RepID=UPI0004F470F5|nr:hypothetical protein DQ04_00411220 [Trypanosoma grayi]KEG14558.1 hypothetical protein DQ04_00411220 [Trypanosoma grayi]
MTSPLDDASSDERKSPITADVLGNVVVAYLEAVGMREVAAGMRREAKADAASTGSVAMRQQPSCGAAAHSLLSRPPPSALEWLLHTHATTRAVVRRLLRNGEVKVTRQFHAMGLQPPEADTMHYVLDPNERRMWSPQDAADAIYISGGKSAGTGRRMFGTLHQLIEELTHVSVLPLSSLSEDKLRVQEEFTCAFLRQHRYFTSSHTVLAKLMERFLVPLSVQLGFEHFEAHGITVHAPGTSLSPSLCTLLVTSGSEDGEERRRASHFSPSATLWLLVCRKVQMRVLSVLLLWLREYPQHFDEEMHQCINLFLEDCCFTPQPWSDCPSQLAGMAEFVRTSIAASAAAPREQRDCGTCTRQHSLRDCPPTIKVSSSLSPCKEAAAAVASDSGSTIVLEKPPSVLSWCTARDFSLVAPIGEHWVEDAKEVVRLFVAVPVEQCATALTSFHQNLFASLQAESLLQVAHHSAAAYLCSSAFRLSSVGLFLTASAELAAWTVSVLLHAAALDSLDVLQERDALSLGKNFIYVHRRFVDLVVSLMRLNNLHGAVGVYQGLRHPLLQRVIKQPRLLALLPASTLQNVAHLGKLLEANNSVEGESVQLLEDYMKGIPDVDIHPPIPPVQRYLTEIGRLRHTMPSFLTVRTDEMYPPRNTGKVLGDIVVVHWRKYMIADQLLSRVMAWQNVTSTTTRDEAFERQFAEQRQRVVHEPWRLARLANEFLSVL